MRAKTWMVACSATVVLACGTRDEGPPFQARADVKQLMISIVDPAADAVWDSVGTIIDENGIDEWYPKTDEEWAAVENAAIVIMESGNLLMIGDRARDQETWMRMSQQMTEAGALALEAARSRDPDAVFAVGEEVYFACDRCHGLYWIDDRDRGRIRDTPRSRQSTQ